MPRHRPTVPTRPVRNRHVLTGPPSGEVFEGGAVDVAFVIEAKIHVRVRPMRPARSASSRATALIPSTADNSLAICCSCSSAITTGAYRRPDEERAPDDARSFDIIDVTWAYNPMSTARTARPRATTLPAGDSGRSGGFPRAARARTSPPRLIHTIAAEHPITRMIAAMRPTVSIAHLRSVGLRRHDATRSRRSASHSRISVGIVPCPHAVPSPRAVSLSRPRGERAQARIAWRVPQRLEHP